MTATPRWQWQRWSACQRLRPACATASCLVSTRWCQHWLLRWDPAMIRCGTALLIYTLQSFFNALTCISSTLGSPGITDQA
jgi:hypothetical protein